MASDTEKMSNAANSSEMDELFNGVDDLLLLSQQKDQLSASELRDMVDELFEIDHKLSGLKREVKNLEDHQKFKEATVRAVMVDLGMKDASGSDGRRIAISDKENFSAPTTDDTPNWMLLKDYIRTTYGEESIESLFRIHATKAATWIRDEITRLREEKRRELRTINPDITEEQLAEAFAKIKIPGAPDPYIKEVVTYSKAKEKK